MKIFHTIFLFVSMLGLSACVATPNYPEQQRPPTIADSLSGHWFLTSLNNSGYQGPRITLQFADNHKINGFSGCNRYFGPANVGNNGSIAFEQVSSTRRLCISQEGNRVERNYLKALRAIQSYQLSGDRLILSGTGTHLVFYRKGFK